MFRFHVSVSLLDFSEVNGAEKGAGPVGPGWVQLELFQTRKLRDFVEIAEGVFAKVNLCRMVSHDF